MWTGAGNKSSESTVFMSHFAPLGQSFILHDRILFHSNADDRMNVVHSAEVARASVETLLPCVL